MRSVSLTRRLILIVALSQLLVAAGLLGVGAWYARRQLLSAFDTALRGRAISLAALVRYRETGGGLVFDPALMPPPAHRHHPDQFEIWAVPRTTAAAAAPSRLALSAPPPPPFLTTGRAQGFVDFSAAGVPYRALVLRDMPVLDTEEGVEGPPSRLDLVYAASTLGVRHRVADVEWAIALASLFFLALALGFAAWAIPRGLRPLRDLAARADGISVGHWGFRAPESALGAAELAPLIAALERMLEGLRAAFRRQHEFLADAAHELKTPVAILKSSLQSLLQRPREGEEYRAAARRSLEDVERLEALLARMLRLARAEQFLTQSERQAPPPADPAEALLAARERLLPLAEAQAVALAPPEMPLASPAGAGGARVLCAAEDLETVLVNLIENAIRHSPAGGVIATRVAAAGEGSEATPGVTIEVADHGEGIAPEELPRLFQRFHRADPSRARDTGGFGLGLAICKAIIESCGGAIRITSAPGAGTTATVTLPAARVERAASAPGAGAGRAQGSAARV